MDVLKAGFWKVSPFSLGDEERIRYQSDTGIVLWMLKHGWEKHGARMRCLAVVRAIKTDTVKDESPHGRFGERLKWCKL